MSTGIHDPRSTHEVNSLFLLEDVQSLRGLIPYIISWSIESVYFDVPRVAYMTYIRPYQLGKELEILSFKINNTKT